MSKPILAVEIGEDGQPVCLKAWAEKNGLNYTTVLHRWHMGARDPEALKQKLPTVKRKPITEEDIRYLQETRYYRRDQLPTMGSGGHRDSEWVIACDLIGIPRSRAEELRKAVESHG